ncbi:hypothetical protein [Maricaulis sp.]|uniref:hypothetical protein n=1 Tax=Maricaulis sp. TaxID=1486257 RepID=UPI002601B3E2|nr:hypothetical protein [Maricaulis sp.]
MRRWHKPIPLSSLLKARVPDTPGVFMLLAHEADLSSVLKIAPARSLRKAFERELEPADGYQPVLPEALMYFETVTETAEAERLLTAYRRKHGKNPALNSPF